VLDFKLETAEGSETGPYGGRGEWYLLDHDHSHNAAVEGESDGEDPLAKTDRPDVFEVDEMEGGNRQEDREDTGEGHCAAIPQEVHTEREKKQREIKEGRGRMRARGKGRNKEGVGVLPSRHDDISDSSSSWKTSDKDNEHGDIDNPRAWVLLHTAPWHEVGSVVGHPDEGSVVASRPVGRHTHHQ
jgi:hypothetical protein